MGHSKGHTGSGHQSHGSSSRGSSSSQHLYSNYRVRINRDDSVSIILPGGQRMHTQSVTADGSCYFRSILAIMGSRIAQRSVQELRELLFNSGPYTDDDETRIMNPDNYASPTQIQLLAQQLDVTVVMLQMNYGIERIVSCQEYNPGHRRIYMLYRTPLGSTTFQGHIDPLL